MQDSNATIWLGWNVPFQGYDHLSSRQKSESSTGAPSPYKRFISFCHLAWCSPSVAAWAFVEEGVRHGATASVVGKQPDEDLALEKSIKPAASQAGGKHGGYRSISQYRM